MEKSSSQVESVDFSRNASQLGNSTTTNSGLSSDFKPNVCRVQVFIKDVQYAAFYQNKQTRKT